jgi:hypothetical protein
MSAEKKVIDEATLIPISAVWKVLAACVILVPAIGWAFTVQTKLDYIQRDIADIKDGLSEQRSVSASIAQERE